MQLFDLTIKEIADKLQKKEISSTYITKLMLDRIEKSNLNAFNYIDSDGALKQAELADSRIAKGETLSPLDGVPIAIKDNICIDGIPMTCSSKMLKDYVPPYSATVIEKLKNSGAVLIGKTNMDEFAMGSSNETSYFGKVLNPINADYVPGGSSGGSTAAVAGSLCYGALGTDTGGSIRQPASFCGVVGLKPTYGVVSRYGAVAVSSSLDQIGTLTKSVQDTAILLNAISGYDSMDSTSQNIKYPDYTKCFSKSVKGLKIGVPKEFFSEMFDEGVVLAVKKAIQIFKDNGAEIVDISLPLAKVSLSAYYVISCAEATSNLARFDGIKYGYRTEKFEDLADLYVKTRNESFGAEVKRRIMMGNYFLSANNYNNYFLKAQKIRTLIKQDFDSVFSKCDIIIGPTSPVTAFKFGDKSKDPTQMYMSDICTAITNLAGIPAITLPCGKDKGMPVGLQIIGNVFEEEKILNAADFYESAEGYKWITK